MTNAKKELLHILQMVESYTEGEVAGLIKCATISTERHSYWDNDNYVSAPKILLKEGHTPAEYEAFLNQLDFEYDSGYGGQELFGTVWLTKENTWLERGEYDGSEWWEYRECPQVPNELKA